MSEGHGTQKDSDFGAFWISYFQIRDIQLPSVKILTVPWYLRQWIMLRKEGEDKGEGVHINLGKEG